MKYVFEDYIDRIGFKNGAGILPRIKINGKWYFVDMRLREFRNVDDFNDSIKFDEMEG